MQMKTVTDKRKIFNLICFLTSCFLGFLFCFPCAVIAADTQINISVQASIQDWGATSTPPVAPGGGSGWVIIPEASLAKAVFMGRAYPGALITILRNEAVAAVFFAEDSGSFRKEISGIPGGNQYFGIWAQDTEGRNSLAINFDVNMLADATTTISGIFIPPTVFASPVKVERGEDLLISGQSFPESNVKIFLNEKMAKKEIEAKNGKWSYKLNTANLAEGDYQIKAQSLFGQGEQSPFSQIFSFMVLRKGKICKGPDLNFNNKVDITDFSILLYFWKQKKPSNACADINFDGIVDIRDFSIMMYWWTS